METIRRLRGFRDIIGEEIEKFRKIEEVSRKYLSLLGYKEIKIPILEKTELFVRSIGEATDIVRKEMFSFTDLSGDSVTLRPEATAGMVRAYIEGGFFNKERITRIFTIGSMFRHERPQKGRFREFNQIDVEVFGSSSPFVDAELIWLISLIVRDLKVQNFQIEVNTVGCPDCRKKFRDLFSRFIASKTELLCSDCKERAMRNPLRIFDCKKETCLSVTDDAPLLFDVLCEQCTKHFETFLRYVEGFKVQVKHKKRLVRGLDYYTRTVFEVTSSDLGAQNAFIAGGRYDNLVKDMGGPDVPGIGFAIGLDRLSLIIPIDKSRKAPRVFVATIGEAARENLSRVLEYLVLRNIAVYYEPEPRSLKSQMRHADSLNVDLVLIIGEEEIKKGIVLVKDMKRGTQKSYPINLEGLVNDILEGSIDFK